MWLLSFFTDERFKLESGEYYTLKKDPIPKEELPKDAQIPDDNCLQRQGIEKYLGYKPEYSDDPIQIKSGETFYLAKQIKHGDFKLFKVTFQKKKSRRAKQQKAAS